MLTMASPDQAMRDTYRVARHKRFGLITGDIRNHLKLTVSCTDKRVQIVAQKKTSLEKKTWRTERRKLPGRFAPLSDVTTILREEFILSSKFKAFNAQYNDQKMI